MPPFIPQKRQFSQSPSPPPSASKPKANKRLKPSLFDTADKPKPSASLQDNKTFLNQLTGSNSDDSLSDISSDEFEDALPSPGAKRRKVAHVEEDDGEVDWEDAIQADATPSTHVEPSGDLELTLDADSNPIGFHRGSKKGPSKIERQIRISTHCMHVQFLLFHNLVRNGWACDKEIGKILVAQLPFNVKKEVEKWKTASGLSQQVTVEASPKLKKGKGKRKSQSERNQRDWGKPAERQEIGAPNMSRGDPVIRLLKILAAYWKKKWTITAPMLRKQGYKPIAQLQEEVTGYEKDKHSSEEHGERINGIGDVRDHAKSCEGSRDIGAQLFTALLRGLGLEARLVSSLQPVGFGWSKAEEALIKKKRIPKDTDPDENEASSSDEPLTEDVSSKKENNTKSNAKPKSRKRRLKGGKDAPIDLSKGSDDSKVQDGESEDDGSIIDVTPVTPRKRPNMNYDRDMAFPTYWAEAISPITSEIYPVDPFILTPAVATNGEHLALFESRGPKADKAKQVFAYVVGYSSDGTAKDITTRYLKRHMWPGRTKGVRLPVERIPIYNARGKIKRHEDYDWFKTVMSAYSRTDKMRTLVDELEEAKDLKAVKPEKKEHKAGEETLQGYKSSAEFVLERHLRREEALRPGAKPVKTFATGKGDNVKEEPVYRRKDVEVCRTGESWHKEGRALKAGQVPMKLVPVRAVTLTRKREVEEAERDSGEKPKQGLYSRDQTDWIIPPPIENGVIPKNAYGNMDCYVPTMVPKGAVHIPLRSTARICKRFEIDYAEAVTGFEFGNKRAVPVITGVVVAAENENKVIDQWEKDEEERKIKEEGKREKAALATWRKWLMGLRIVQRVREEYGGDADAHVREEMNPFTNQNRVRKTQRADGGEPPVKESSPSIYKGEDMEGGFLGDDDMGGGFLPEGYDEEEVPQSHHPELTTEEENATSRNTMPEVEPSALPRAESDNPEQDGDDTDVPNTGEAPSTANMKPKVIVDGSASKQPQPKASTRKPPAPKKPRGRPRKSEAFPPPHRPNEATLADTDEEPSPPKKNARAAPKRKAARKSETAVKSHYFDHGSDEEQSSSAGNDTSEEDEPVRATKRNKGSSDSVAKTRRSLRTKRK